MVVCPVCNTTTKKVLTSKLRRGDGVVYHCEVCDLGFLKNMIDDTKKYYDNEYRKEYSHQAQENDTNAKELFDVYVNFQEDRLRIIEEYQDTQKNFLEIGASAGQFLFHLDGKFKSLNAIELDSSCCSFMEKEFNVQTDSNYLQDSRFYKENLYDVVSAFQVLEHTPNPIAFLESIYNVLKKGGIALVEVPNLYDPLLSVWDVPAYNTFYYHSAHSYYFSAQSLENVAKKAGFKVLDTHFLQDYNLLNHINWITNDTPQPDCMQGLNQPRIEAKDKDIESWLNNELEILNRKYFKKLAESKKTANILMVIQK